MKIRYLSRELSRFKITDGPPKALIAQSLTREKDKFEVSIKVALREPWPETARGTIFLFIDLAQREDGDETWYLMGETFSDDFGQGGPFEASYSSKHRNGWFAWLNMHTVVRPKDFL